MYLVTEKRKKTVSSISSFVVDSLLYSCRRLYLLRSY